MKNFVLNDKVREVLLENQEKIIGVKKMTELVFEDKYGWMLEQQIKSVKGAMSTQQRKYMFKHHRLILVPVKDENSKRIEGWKVSSDQNDEDIRFDRKCRVDAANSRASSAAEFDKRLVDAKLLYPEHAFKHEVMFELRPNEVIKQLN